MKPLHRAALLLAAGFVAILGFGAYSPDTVYVTDNNATLRNIPSTAVPHVTRLGYATPGDAPPLVFKASNAACSLASGNGDGGSQVKSLDNKCWIAQFPDNSRIDIRQFGAKPFTGAGVPSVGDDVAPFIRTAYLADVGRLYAPGSVGVWPLMSAAVADGKPLKLIGDYPQELQGTHACPTGRPVGTWFRIPAGSTGQFFVNGGAGLAIQGSSLEEFGICQDHTATIGVGWAPNLYPPAIKLISVSGCYINRIFWYGVYDAFDAHNSARCTITEQRGQFFHIFWTSDHLLDLTQWHNWHLWTIWSGDTNVVWSWQAVNGEVAQIRRMDALQATNIFALGYKEVFHFMKSVDADPGPAAGINVGPLYCDGVKHCIHVDVDAPQTVAAFGQINAGGEKDKIINSVMVYVEGGSTNLSIASMYCLVSYGPCVQVNGPNSFVGIGWAYALNYDTAGVGYNAFRANSTDGAFPSYIALAQYPTGSFSNIPPGNTTPPIDNTTPNGYVSVGGVITRDYVPALTFNGTSAGMTYSGTPSGKITKNLYTGEVHGNAKLTLTAKGSSTGSAGVTLPAGFSGSTAIGKVERDQMGGVIYGNAFVGSPVAPFVFAPANATALQLLQNGTGAFLTEANFSNTTSISFAW